MELLTADTPNGEKIHIALCELGLRPTLTRVDLAKGEQRTEEFLRLSPNAKIPVLRDGELTIFESGAILLHLAQRAGKLLPSNPVSAVEARSWLFWQVSAVGPTFGTLHALMNEEPVLGPAVLRFQREARRLFSVLESRLDGREFIAGEYSVADIACFPWMHEPEFLGIDPKSIPQVMAWVARVAARPGVQAGRRLLDN